jgi:hypothetical protein
MTRPFTFRLAWSSQTSQCGESVTPGTYAVDHIMHCHSGMRRRDKIAKLLCAEGAGPESIGPHKCWRNRFRARIFDAPRNDDGGGGGRLCLSFRGASKASEPGIHRAARMLGEIDSGSGANAPSRNDGGEGAAQAMPVIPGRCAPRATSPATPSSRTPISDSSRRCRRSCRRCCVRRSHPSDGCS